MSKKYFKKSIDYYFLFWYTNVGYSLKKQKNKNNVYVESILYVYSK